VLAITIKFSPNAATLFPFFLSSDLAQLPMAYYKTSLMALEAADYLAVPQIRHIQVNTLFTGRVLTAGIPGIRPVPIRMYTHVG
jgi:hypothetical protein